MSQNMIFQKSILKSSIFAGMSSHVYPFYFLSVIDTSAYKIHVCYCYKYLKPNAWKTREKLVCANFAVLLSISLYRFSIFLFPYRESIIVVSEYPITKRSVYVPYCFHLWCHFLFFPLFTFLLFYGTNIYGT